MGDNSVYQWAYWRNYRYFRHTEGMTAKQSRKHAAKMTKDWYARLKSDTTTMIDSMNAPT